MEAAVQQRATSGLVDLLFVPMGERARARMVAAAGGAMLLAACGGAEQVEPSATVTETVTITATPEESPAEETGPEPESEPEGNEDGVSSFGDHFEWEDGIQVHVAQPKPIRRAGTHRPANSPRMLFSRFVS